MTISDYAELQILDAVFNADAFSVTNVYIQLHTGTPGEAGTSNVATETTRKQITFGAAASGQVVSDASASWTDIAGPAAPTTESISAISLWDASSAGNCLWAGNLTTAKDISDGDTLTFATGAITVTLN